MLPVEFVKRVSFLYHARFAAGIRAIMELMHLIVRAPQWNAEAYERASGAVISASRSVGKSLEHANLSKIVRALHGPDRRFADPTTDEVRTAYVPDARMSQSGQE